MNENDLRQFLLAHALQGLCANPNVVRSLEPADADAAAVADLAIYMADLLLESEAQSQAMTRERQ